MNIKAAMVAALALVGLSAPTAIATSNAADRSHSPALATSVDLDDARGDVAKPKLDVKKVRVVNTPARLRVRVYFPGVAETYDFPLGYVSVWLDTDADRAGPEYGHFMQFWSDYRFARTKGWRELPSPEWSHSPEGPCVEYAGLTSDKHSRLRWFEYIVQKTHGCFQSDSVRVAVTTVNEGENNPYRLFDQTYADHLGERHSWSSAWIASS